VLVLALETATAQVGAALADEDGTIASSRLARGRRHVETLHLAVSELCGHAGVSLAELGAVVADVGPGLFTGLRVGIGAAKAMAQALEVPVVGVLSLEVLAEAVLSMPVPRCSDPERGTMQAELDVVAVVDARRGEVFAARYRRNLDPACGRSDPASTIDEPGLWKPADLAEELVRTYEHDRPSSPGGPYGAVVLIGDGAMRYCETSAQGSVTMVGTSLAGAVLAGRRWSHPSPSMLAEIGALRASRGELTPPEELAPVYLREADARINWEQRSPAQASDLAGASHLKDELAHGHLAHGRDAGGGTGGPLLPGDRTGRLR
ncbi:MAG: tRNA (adenosine(37)-N6)-threonylcarbamoyltransferase complex dimerization subunit type 1 TsaB, partial [Actinobacteria bacterium]|nr:tRNA (adenosine(37)-N6)-threonylcarbamoyltransferase complex dimerization subunit type 1 TsaB [Actinomycetota bacterium]